MTTKNELEELVRKINIKLESNNSPLHLEIRGAYGKVGLSTAGFGRNVTGLMTKKELAAYMTAALDGLYMFQ